MEGELFDMSMELITSVFWFYDARNQFAKVLPFQSKIAGSALVLETRNALFHGETPKRAFPCSESRAYNVLVIKMRLKISGIK